MPAFANFFFASSTVKYGNLSFGMTTSTPKRVLISFPYFSFTSLSICLIIDSSNSQTSRKESIYDISTSKLVYSVKCLVVKDFSALKTGPTLNTLSNPEAIAICL